jgi:hypothetical protein
LTLREDLWRVDLTLREDLWRVDLTLREGLWRVDLTLREDLWRVDLTLREGERSEPCPGHLTFLGNSPQCPLNRSLGGPLGGLHGLEKNGNSDLYRHSNPEYYIFQATA